MTIHSAPTPIRPDEAAGSDSHTERVRLGVIDYLNVVPVYDALLRRERQDGGLPGIATVAGVPAEMNRALIAGQIDISNVSSFAFGSHADEWLLVPQLSVAAQGRVDSVLLFSWQADWRALDGGSIALTSDSATSVELVRLLSEQRYGISPRYVPQPPDLDAMLSEHDAALLIGDVALIEGSLRRAIGDRGHPYVFDLAAEWQAWTGLPFVFAVWAARAEQAEAIRASGVVDALYASKRRGLAQLDTLAAEAAARLELPRDICARYLRLLDYELSERDLVGLRRFLELAIPDFSWEQVHFL